MNEIALLDGRMPSVRLAGMTFAGANLADRILKSEVTERFRHLALHFEKATSVKPGLYRTDGLDYLSLP